MIKKTLTALLLLAASLCCHAEVIEHTTDGYIIHVDQMQLGGEESLLDVLMMCPEAFTTDGRENLEDYSIRIFNQILPIDPDIYLGNTKAKHIADVQVYMHTALLNPVVDTQYIIEVTYRDDQPSYGEVTMQATTKGGATGYMDMAQKLSSQFTLWSQVQADLNYSSAYFDDGDKVSSHSVTEAVRIGTQWTPSDKDKINANFSHYYDYARIRQWDLSQKTGYWAAFINYERQLHSNGMYLYVEGGGEWIDSRIKYEEEDELYNDDDIPTQAHQRLPNSHIGIEYATPLGTDNLWLTLGAERGWSNTRNVILDRDEHWSYTDGYFQLEYKTSRWGVSFADRISHMPAWYADDKGNVSRGDNETKHSLQASANVALNKTNTLQAIYSRKYNASITGELMDDGSPTLPYMGRLDGMIAYYYGRFASVPQNKIELRHTLQTGKMVLMSHISNEHWNGIENELNVGTSFTYTWSWLRLLAAASFTHYKEIYQYSSDDYSNYFNLRLAPQFTLPHGWYITTTMLYNSRITGLYLYTPSSFYLAMRASKRFNKHWNVYADFYNIAQQRLGNRTLAIGGTYAF